MLYLTSSFSSLFFREYLSNFFFLSLQRKRPDTSRGDFIISFTPNTSSNLRPSSLCLIQILSNISENGHVLTDVIHFTMESGSPHFVIGYFSMDRFFSVQQEEYIPANLKYCYRFFSPINSKLHCELKRI